MSKSKDKGRRGEHKVVKVLADHGIAAKRQILSGSHKDYPGDVILDCGLTLEVKNREVLPGYLFEYAKQGNCDLVALTKADEEVIFIMTAKQLAFILL